MGLLTGGVLLGAALVGSPVGGHVGSTVNHLWNHIKPKADVRYVNETEALWAVVNSNATLARGSGVSSVDQESTGNYRVFFTRNVTSCAFNATIGLAGSSGTSPAGFITVVGAAGDGTLGEPNENGVFVTTDDTTGASAARSFHLEVLCANTASPAREIGPAGGPSVRRGANTRR